MQAVCPITNQRINEQVARMNALFTLFFIVTFIVFKFWIGLAFLMVDFWIRGFIGGKYSLLNRMNMWVVSQLNLSPKMINAGPKIFAAQVGTVLSSVALLGYFMGCSFFCIIIAGILGFFSFLEMAFGYCVACKLYPLFRRNVN